VPEGLARIVGRLLEKAPDDRFQSAADLTWALEQARTAPVTQLQSVPERNEARSTVRRRWAWTIAPVALALIVFAWWRMPASPVDPPARAITRFTWTLPEGTTLFSAPVVSPDGRRICWTGLSESAGPQVFVREMSSLDARPVPGTEGGLHPFWSPDSQAIGFFARGKLQRIAVDGGPPVVLADAPEPRGGTWSQAGVIVFAPSYRDSPLMRVSDHGGEVTAVTVLDRAQEEVTSRWPAFLPDGIHFLYNIVSLRDDRRGVYVGSVDDPAPRSTQPLFTSESDAVYASLGDGRHGVLLSVGNGRIEVRPFDPVRRVLEGDARTLDVAAVGTTPHHAALLSASADVLAYSAVMVPWGSRFAIIGRDGTDLQLS
jgi:hypothetical protein